MNQSLQPNPFANGIPELVEEPVTLIDPAGFEVGVIQNNLQFAFVRAEIRSYGLKGYSVVFRGDSYPIEQNGRGLFPNEMFGLWGCLLDTLIKPAGPMPDLTPYLKR
ncbi:hypothetical protein GCM10028806_34630 [Spirosoma terrae]|uniref:Uncharacterized protein n=1 Tax=Spirosoma terrae TaxID=1968276 RepID=A0A6L9L8F2_9BACT|nr:hypothetical protein [Spirosoma terrae]NDU95777.1 hypothetical protein [Spirosoma terrae]